MPLQIIRQDITKMEVDAIVNTTNQNLIPDGGIDAAIHRVAGARLLEYCRCLGGISVGEAKITPAFDLPCKFVIHTVGPKWNGGLDGERVLLRSCYTECMNLAIKNGLESIAFPLISSGLYGYPKDKVLLEAEDVIKEMLEQNEIDVYLVVYDKTSYSISKEIHGKVQTFIDNFYVNSHFEKRRELCEQVEYSRSCDMRFSSEPPRFGADKHEARRQRVAPLRESSASASCIRAARRDEMECLEECALFEPLELLDMIKDIDKSFADTLLHYIDKKGMTDVEAYKGANISRKAFSKLRCDKNYKPSKITAISYAISLHLDIEEAKHLLLTAGYALSRSYLMDVIIEYFLTSGAYKDIHEINLVLDQYDLPSLGCTK